MNETIIHPIKLRAWKWPAAPNFVMGGMAAGFYILIFLFEVQSSEASIAFHSFVLKLLAPAMVCLGFLSLALEAGRPLRSYNLLRNMRRSWMSLETLSGGIFVALASTDWLFPNQIIQGCAFVAALVFIVSQGFILYSARSVASWNVPVMPVSYLISCGTMGAGLAMILASLNTFTMGPDMSITIVFLLLIDLVIWLFYLFAYEDDIFRSTTKALRSAVALITTVGIGLLLPIILLLLTSSLPEGAVTDNRSVLALAGITIVIGGAFRKIGILLGTDYLREITIVKPGLHNLS